MIAPVSVVWGVARWPPAPATSFDRALEAAADHSSRARGSESSPAGKAHDKEDDDARESLLESKSGAPSNCSASKNARFRWISNFQIIKSERRQRAKVTSCRPVTSSVPRVTQALYSFTRAFYECKKAAPRSAAKVGDATATRVGTSRRSRAHFLPFAFARAPNGNEMISPRAGSSTFLFMPVRPPIRRLTTPLLTDSWKH